jgi:hypothetical protein
MWSKIKVMDSIICPYYGVHHLAGIGNIISMLKPI